MNSQNSLSGHTVQELLQESVWLLSPCFYWRKKVKDEHQTARAMRKRVREGILIDKRRRRKAKESYRCYLAYMKYRSRI